jgi:hypothetical protein
MHRLIFALFLTGAFAAAAEAENCGLSIVAPLKFDPAYGGAPVVQMTLNGTPALFLVITNAAFSGLDPKTIASLGLKNRTLDHQEIWFGGKIATQYVVVDRLEIGVMHSKGAQFVVIPENTLTGGLAGFIGADLLANFDVDMDFSAHTINLISPKHCKGKVVYWTTQYVDVPFYKSFSGFAVFPMQLDAQTVNAVIASGSPMSTISESTAAEKFKLNPESPGLEKPSGEAVSGLSGSRYRFDSLSVEGVTITHPLLHVIADADQRAFKSKYDDKADRDPTLATASLEHQDVTLGDDVLSRLHVYIAYGEKKLYISAANPK